ncbi:pyridoxal phosphate phosphatase PHOSPHO2-like [Lytechinus pictus]|uniref:pyridoxal phosphate phosphatase PHOSPHO2-like n=1 Tax=Lytechinus pictus TaxID=7653 RepID=UPI0030BA1BAA
MASSKEGTPHVLVALDCDHTIIDGNSDTWIMALLPDHMVPKNIKRRFKTEHNSWTIYMGEIFEYMHSIGIGEAALHDSIAGIPLTPGMKELFEYQASCPRLDFIVISDSNSYFIDVILGSRGFQRGVNKIYTNQAEFTADGCLKIHFSNPHICPRKCPKNLCKQTSLRAFLEEQRSKGIEYDRVCMVGDGQNDFCPCFCLKERDYVFPRKGYSLVKLLQERKERQSSADDDIIAIVKPWDSATEILNVVKGFFDS